MGTRLITELQPRLASLYRHALEQGMAMDCHGDIEPLHRYRVALRKLRCLLKLYRPYLPQEAVQALLVSTGQQARISNRMRDLDVFADSLGEAHPLAALVRQWREETFTQLYLALGQLKRERQLCLVCLSLPWGKGEEAFEEVTGKLERKLTRKAEKDLHRARESGTAEDWHRLRLRIKAQRYLKEVCLPHKPWKREKALQDALGEFNDSCSQIGFLESRLDEVDEGVRPQMKTLLGETRKRMAQQLAQLNQQSWQAEQN
ncbi:CHAD domain-containing protein [Ferrimonas futtsuensis]|uniref:CHAD domain-containing protein n=1 Tax=Ferrimonas futtsuensis TaxID=364764 RepID=UPI0003FC413F|nr:CHAD domain-containing protein [Ferrimonas futtsuensis]